MNAIGYLDTPEDGKDRSRRGWWSGRSIRLVAGGTIAPVAAPTEICGVPSLGTIEDLDAVIAAQRPHRIVVGMTERRKRLPVERLLHLRFSGIHIEEASVTFEYIFHRVSTRDLRPSQLIFSTELGPRPQSVALQSVYSWILGAILMIIALPVMAVVAVLVKMTSPGPSLFRQTRVGLNGTNLSVYKFRSMYQDAEARTGAVWATRDDPRVTPLGRWLRRLRLDEFPQLFNVVRGEMSLVGPRPERPEFVKILQEKIPYYAQRNCVKPGLTGWAQINHKYGDTVEDSLIKFEYDLYYIKNSGDFYLDLCSIVRTPSRSRCWAAARSGRGRARPPARLLHAAPNAGFGKIAECSDTPGQAASCQMMNHSSARLWIWVVFLLLVASVTLVRADSTPPFSLNLGGLGGSFNVAGKTLASGLNYPYGLALTPDGSFLLEKASRRRSTALKAEFDRFRVDASKVKRRHAPRSYRRFSRSGDRRSRHTQRINPGRERRGLGSQDDFL